MLESPQDRKRKSNRSDEQFTYLPLALGRAGKVIRTFVLPGLHHSTASQ